MLWLRRRRCRRSRRSLLRLCRRWSNRCLVASKQRLLVVVVVVVMVCKQHTQDTYTRTFILVPALFVALVPSVVEQVSRCLQTATTSGGGGGGDGV